MKLRTLASSMAASLGTRLQAMFTPPSNSLERGHRVASDIAMQREMRQAMFVDYDRRALVDTIRKMDQQDGRVKEIHRRVSSDLVRGGLVMQVTGESAEGKALAEEWKQFAARLKLTKQAKLKSDAAGFLKEGNLALQLVLDQANSVTDAVRMPSDTLVPIVAPNGRFKDPAHAFEQRDVMTGKMLASFAAYQLVLARLDPDNYDDMGSMGRPFLDAVAKTWRKLMMTDEDLVIRRRTRAPLRLSHVLEGADDTALAAYRKTTEGEKGEITTDFYSNRKGGVTAVQGDATLGDIEDVVHLLDTFYAGTPAPKGLFGYVGDLSRDVLADLKQAYFEALDGIQDEMADAYDAAFRVHLLFQGKDPAPDAYTLRFAERRTETTNQVADLALKWQALGVPDDVIFTMMGMDPTQIRAQREAQAKRREPYPDPGAAGGTPPMPGGVTITPGQAGKGQSATHVPTPGTHHGRGR